MRINYLRCFGAHFLRQGGYTAPSRTPLRYYSGEALTGPRFTPDHAILARMAKLWPIATRPILMHRVRSPTHEKDALLHKTQGVPIRYYFLHCWLASAVLAAVQVTSVGVLKRVLFADGSVMRGD